MTPMGLTPNIIEERQMNVAVFDVFSRLMMDRIIFMGTGINDQVANIIQAQLLFLESTDASKDIQIYINSPGGSVYAGLGIYDTMQLIKPDVATICTLDISIPLRASKDNVNAWYLPPPKIYPAKVKGWTGSIKEGAAVNFNTIEINPHAHGTHTECVGHITKEVHTMNS